MRKWNMLLILIMCFVGLSLPSWAQSARQGKASGKANARKSWSNGLGLSADQIDKIEKLRLKRNSDLAAARGDNSQDRKQKRTRTREINENYNNSFRSILTPEQQLKWDALQKERLQQGKQNKDKSARRKNKPAATV